MCVGVGDSERVGIRNVLPDGMDLREFDPEIVMNDPVIVFTDLTHADEVCGKIDAERIIFLCDSEELSAKSNVLLQYPVRALLDRKQLLGGSIEAKLLVPPMIGKPWNLEIDTVLSEDLVSTIIASSTDRDLAFKRIITLFAERCLDAREAASLRLVIEELTTNALVHAFDESDGVRYEPGGFEGMRLDDHVTIDYGLNDENFVLKVKDSAGSLDPAIVRQRLHRQFSGAGLLDTSGRGFFLGFSIATLFAINVDPGRSTEVITIYNRDRGGGNSLLINVKR